MVIMSDRRGQALSIVFMGFSLVYRSEIERKLSNNEPDLRMEEMPLLIGSRPFVICTPSDKEQLSDLF